MRIGPRPESIPVGSTGSVDTAASPTTVLDTKKAAVRALSVKCEVILYLAIGRIPTGGCACGLPDWPKKRPAPVRRVDRRKETEIRPQDRTAASAATAAGFNFLVGPQAQPRVILDALHAVTSVKVLSNPSLVVID